MKFSVVIPLYNGAKFIEATLDSVLAQTYKDYEIILVNDGSPDNVEDVVKEYISEHKEVSFMYKKQENRGLGGARNTAIRQATGEIIAILDQDDIWYSDKLERIVEMYKRNTAIDIICHSQNIRSSGRITRVFRPEPIKDDTYRQMLFANRFADNIFSTSAVVFKKAIIDKIGSFSQDRTNMHFVEDYDLWLRMAQAGYGFYSSDEILGECSKHDSNFSKELDTMLNGELWVLKKHYKDFKAKSLRDWYLMRRRLAMVYFRISRKHFKSKQINNWFKYLLKAFSKDPFFASYYLQKLIYKTRKLAV